MNKCHIFNTLHWQRTSVHVYPLHLIEEKIGFREKYSDSGLYNIDQWSPTILASGIGFMGQFFHGPRGQGGCFLDDSSALHLLCTLLFIIIALQYIMKQVSKWVLVAQSCLTLCDPMDCSPPGSFVHEIFQARILECVVISISRGFSQSTDWTRVSCTAELQGKSKYIMKYLYNCHLPLTDNFDMSLKVIDLLWSLCSQTSLLMIICICSHSPVHHCLSSTLGFWFS